MALKRCYVLRRLWFVPAGMHTPISLFSEQILGARLYKDLCLNNQYKVIIFYQVHLLSEQTYHPPCSTSLFWWWQRYMYTFLHDFCFYGTIHSPKSCTINFVFFFLHSVGVPCHLGKKEKKKWKLHWFHISVTVCLKRPLQFLLKVTSSL